MVSVVDILPSHNEPLRLADGKLVYPDGKVVDPNKPQQKRFIQVPTNQEAQALIVATRRKISDLPDIPKVTNPVSVVISYTLFGLSDEEIALATNLTTSQITNIKSSAVYKSMHADIVNSILSAEADTVRDIFVQKSRRAALNITDGLDSDNPAERLLASKEVLDRAGFRPADIVEHRHNISGGLAIEIIKKVEDNSPLIDLSLGDN